MEGFKVTSNIAAVFFRYCLKYNIKDEKRRIEVFRRLVAKKKAKYIPRPQEYLKDKKVLVIKKSAPKGYDANNVN